DPVRPGRPSKGAPAGVSVVVVGLNQRTVPLELLERMAVPTVDVPKALADLSSRDNISEAVLLSTCWRTEVYLVAERFHGAVSDVRNFLSLLSACPPEDFGDHLYSYYDDAAVAHLFKVASGLDSAVLGEGEVLGQVRDAWETARQEGAAGSALGHLFRHAVEVGKRARSETGIARGTTSLSQAAVALAAERLGDLADRKVLVLGAGDMGEGMAVALSGRRVGELIVANRTPSTAEALAARAGGHAIALDGLAGALAEVDLVLTSTGSPATLVEAAQLAAVLPARAGRPLLIVDLAVPRDVEPAVGELDGVTLLDMDDITAYAEAAVDGRRQETAKVQVIVDAEVERYSAGVTARQAAPLIAALRDHAEGLRAAEMARFRSRLGSLTEAQVEAVEALTRGLVAKLLHQPTVSVKDAAGTPKGERLAEALRDLFEL
ncbi:MAG TPA: glutamyl-tRNA reductase, partial [Acidimicrobiales bacterium]|nr:glutamyl-tRNA reductase [Acidimicrobiales bacterium]